MLVANQWGNNTQKTVVGYWWWPLWSICSGVGSSRRPKASRHAYCANVIWCFQRYEICYRRKFRSQTSDNMDRWKAEQGRGREKRKIRRKKSRRERVRRKKMQMREKVGKSRNTVFFKWFGAPEGRKVGSLQRRVRSQLARWEMKNCTPLWRRDTFRSENVQNTSMSDHFWKLRCRKSARRAHFEVKMYKTHHSRTTFGSSQKIRLGNFLPNS